MNNSPPTVFVLEDSDLDFELQTLAIRELVPEARIVRASDCCNAPKSFEEIQPSLIVIDVDLPSCNGLAFLEKMRKSQSVSAPVVVFSTSTDASNESRALSAGADQYCVKPVAAAAYLQAVRSFASPYLAVGG
ncbi:putative transcriptional regulatory protein TcrX [Botrimarina colliarenosi]|uniref:Putative transcriptional regulatory protein TcrX n=1 Tax=Botrimarina colliarenosi TaxID=2528001 RepID=A0A5C6AKD4_9BACT|nr:response regulator [Botrimarina colliarenosi]TWT99967.1 putative transcriptional regulatory protein TcrX [Botrimarina colliarenosi]